MKVKKRNKNAMKNDTSIENDREQVRHQIRLPGFLIEKEIGLGDVIKRATSSVGIRPCADCERRAAVLNRWMTFSR
jgi:hypothetical protein